MHALPRSILLGNSQMIKPLCEIGYAWESFVLGYSQFQSSSGDTMLRNWPSKVIARK